MGLPGGAEWLIVLFIVLVIFGGGKIAGVGKSLGTAISEFKGAMKGEDEEEAKPQHHESVDNHTDANSHTTAADGKSH